LNRNLCIFGRGIHDQQGEVQGDSKRGKLSVLKKGEKNIAGARLYIE